MAWIRKQIFSGQSMHLQMNSYGVSPLRCILTCGRSVGIDEVAQVGAQLVVVVVMIAFDGGVLNGSVHSLDLTISPGMVWLGQPMFDAVLAANLVEAVHPIARRPAVAVARQVCGWIPLSVKIVCKR